MNRQGIIPPMITPARAGGSEIDTQSLGDYTDFLVDSGVITEHSVVRNMGLAGKDNL